MDDKQYGLDVDELLSYEIVVDKLDAARRQLESAITMFFYEGDVVSQHTLISAAHGIVYDLAKQQGIKGSVKDSTLILQGNRRGFINAVNLPQNFFKHADLDGKTKLVFHYKVSPLYLCDALRLFLLLGGKINRIFEVFFMWFQFVYPDVLCLQSAEEDLQKLRKNISNQKALKTFCRKRLSDNLT